MKQSHLNKGREIENEYLLEIKNLHVEITGKKVLKGVNLRIKKGETHAFFGPNGSGKTTLLNAIMGFTNYKITKGEIIFRGKNILPLPVNERAKMGIGISFQRPPTVRGVRLKQLIELYSKANGKILEKYAQILNVREFLGREINVGFSGGEIKRVELLQLLLQNPMMVFLDEPESGVDLENITLIGRAINQLLGRKKEPEKNKTMKELRSERKAGLIITHTGHILEYVDVDIGHVLMNGSIVCNANPRDILQIIRKYGYDECYRCFRKES